MTVQNYYTAIATIMGRFRRRDGRNVKEFCHLVNHFNKTNTSPADDLTPQNWEQIFLGREVPTIGMLQAFVAYAKPLVNERRDDGSFIAMESEVRKLERLVDSCISYQKRIEPQTKEVSPLKIPRKVFGETTPEFQKAASDLLSFFQFPKLYNLKEDSLGIPGIGDGKLDQIAQCKPCDIGESLARRLEEFFKRQGIIDADGNRQPPMEDHPNNFYDMIIRYQAVMKEMRTSNRGEDSLAQQLDSLLNGSELSSDKAGRFRELISKVRTLESTVMRGGK